MLFPSPASLLALTGTLFTLGNGLVVARDDADLRAAGPTARTLNGTYAGRYLPEYVQDVFLGIPYAKPPVKNLRFRTPQSLDTSFAGTRKATQYPPVCVGYGGNDQIGYEKSEDCLYVNVIRPASSSYDYASKNPLPVALWIHGGGYFDGGSADKRYNMSFIVRNGVNIDQPIIAVSINYRLSAWGLLAGDEVAGSGNTNLALRDQRLALQWVRENIAAFGGNPNKVTIWGESAGASSVGFHLVAYNGRDDKLFRGAIMESGNPVPYRSLLGSSYFEPMYQAIVANTGCSDSADTLDCLRGLPFATLDKAFNTANATSWYPVVDGDFIQRYPSIQLAEGAFVKVPIISGANSDEGTAFGVRGLNTTEQFLTAVSDGTHRPGGPLPPTLSQQILDAYPDNPCVGIPASLGCERLPASLQYGLQFRRSAAYFGDAVFIANRRQTCQTWTAAGVPAYCYRFNALAAGLTKYIGATHFQEVAFVFDNVNGVGYTGTPPFQGKPESYFVLAKLMSNSWASFVHSQDPNAYRAKNAGDVALWPVYSNKSPQNMVFDTNPKSHPEADTFRAAGIALINKNSIAYHR